MILLPSHDAAWHLPVLEQHLPKHIPPTQLGSAAHVASGAAAAPSKDEVRMELRAWGGGVAPIPREEAPLASR